MGAPSDVFRASDVFEEVGARGEMVGDSTELGLLTTAPLVLVVVEYSRIAFCKARTSAAVPEIIGAEEDDVCCLKLHTLARSSMVEPMELPLEGVVIVEVAEDPLLFCDLLFSLMPVVDADRAGGGAIFRPLLLSLGRLELRGAIAEEGEFSGLFKISPFFRKAVPAFPPPSHM